MRPIYSKVYDYVITVLFPPVGCSDSLDSSTAFDDGSAISDEAEGISTLCQSSPSPTISAIKAPTFISLASSGTYGKSIKPKFIFHHISIFTIEMEHLTNQYFS